MLAETVDSLPAVEASPPTRAQITAFERLLFEQPNRVERELTHTFGPGFYARTLHLKAGDTLTGKVHATEHVFAVTRGELLVATEEGRAHLVAPFQAVCRPGMKRAGHAITDCDVMNVHITDETDLAKLEALLIIPEVIEAPAQPLVIG